MARSLVEHFADLKDPRVNRTKKHRLDDILVIALSALVCGATTFEDIEEFAESREDWFQTVLPLPHGIPSHDTVYRVFCALDATVFARCFAGWMAEVGEALGLNGLTHIAVDGKSLRGATGNTFTGCVHVVTAWATEHGLVLGQEVVADQSNEIPAFPALLNTLKLKGALVTLDAAGCQTDVVDAVRDGGGDYLLAVKGNQPALLAAVEAVFADAAEKEFVGVGATHHEAIEDGHGRHEERYATAIPTPDGVLPDVWRDVAAVVEVTRERTADGTTERTTTYYITSRDVSAAILSRLVRRHWAIENPQPDCWRSDNLCVPRRTGYHRPGGPVRVGRVVRPTSRPRRRPMSARAPLVPPRAPVRRGRLCRRRSGTNSRPSGGGSCTDSSPTCSLDHS